MSPRAPVTKRSQEIGTRSIFTKGAYDCSTMLTSWVRRRLVALDGRGQHDARRVDPVLEAGGADEAHADRLALMLVLGVDAGEEAPVTLVDLVAVLGVVDEEGEVVEERQRVVASVPAHVDGLDFVEPPAPVDVEVDPLGRAALVR